MSMHGRTSAARVAGMCLTALIVFTVDQTAWAGTRAPADSTDSGCPAYDSPNENPAAKAVLDVLQPAPDGDGDFSDCDRIAGLLGLNEDPGGPLGWWPRPDAHDPADPGYGPIPGTGTYGQISDLTGGYTPRKPYRP